MFVTRDLAYTGTNLGLKFLLEQLPYPAHVVPLCGPVRVPISGVEVHQPHHERWNWFRDLWPLRQQLQHHSGPIIVWGRHALSIFGWMMRVGIGNSPILAYWDATTLPTWKEKLLLRKCTQMVTPHEAMVEPLRSIRSVVLVDPPPPALVSRPHSPTGSLGLKCVWLGELDTPRITREAVWTFGVYSYTNPHSTLTIVGEGDDRESNRQFDDAILGVENQQVRFVSLDYLYEHSLNDFDLIHITQIEEDPTSLILLAMSHGLGILAPRTPFTERFIQHRENGMLYTCGDIHEAGRLLLELDQNRPLLEKIRSQAQALAQAILNQYSATGLSRWQKLLGIHESMTTA